MITKSMLKELYEAEGLPSEYFSRLLENLSLADLILIERIVSERIRQLLAGG